MAENGELGAMRVYTAHPYFLYRKDKVSLAVTWRFLGQWPSLSGSFRGVGMIQDKGQVKVPTVTISCIFRVVSIFFIWVNFSPLPAWCLSIWGHSLLDKRVGSQTQEHVSAPESCQGCAGGMLPDCGDALPRAATQLVPGGPERSTLWSYGGPGEGIPVPGWCGAVLWLFLCYSK